MPDVRALAAAYGVRIELADLGDWGTANLVAEYDPDGPVIRVNARRPAGPWLNRAIAHELYHHREAIGETARIANHRAREAAADAFAEALLGAGGSA
ncbi:MAG TPA: hypothetical protein VGD01_08490 [Candidatus Elarobacter sp.]|jgi:hypothetical protein